MAGPRIAVEITGDAKGLSKAFGDAGNSASKLGSTLGKMGKAAILTAGAAGVGGLFAVLKSGIPEFVESEKVAAQTAAALKSTGGAAGVTAKQVGDLAQAISNKTGVDDEAIQSGENLLLTFTNIRNEVGAGNDIFSQATSTITDMSVALGQDMKSSAIQLGKALNDPVKGMTALSRVGVSFTAEQKKTVAALLKTGDTLGAQKLILAELNKEFGGSAVAYGSTVPGALAKLRNAWEGLAGSLVGMVAPAVAAAAEQLSGFITRLSEAQGVRAKLSIVWEGIEGVAKDVVGKLWDAIAGHWESGVGAAGHQSVFREGLWQVVRDAVAGVNWGELGTQIGDAVAAAIDKVNWGGIGGRIKAGMDKASTSSNIAGWGTDFGNKVSDSLKNLSAAIDRVNWAELGGKIITGLGKAIAAVALFLATSGTQFIVDWIKLIAKVVVAQQSLVIGAVVTTFKAAIQGIWKLTTEVYNAGHALGVKTARGIEAGVGNAAAWVKEKLLAVVGAVTSLAGQLHRIALGVGSAIVRGIGEGIEGLVGWLLGKAAGVVKKVKDVLEFWKSPPDAYGKWIGGLVVGGIGDGMTGGIGTATGKAAEVVASIKTVLGDFSGVGDTMKAAMEEAVGKAIKAGTDLIESRKGEFSAAFGSLASGISSAFGTLAGNKKTPAEIELEKMDRAEKEKALLKAESDAGLLLMSAQTAEEKIAAEEAYAEAELAIRRYNLEQQAAAERIGMDAINAVRSEALNARLAAEQEQLETGKQTYVQWHKDVMRILSDYIPNWRTKGDELGQAFITALDKKIREAAKTAQKLADAFTINLKVIASVPKVGIAGERALGGPVRAGSTYLVGERGAELFTPDVNGTIVPNRAVAAASVGGNTTINVYMPHYLGDKREAVQAIRRELGRTTLRNA